MKELNPQNLLGMFIASMRECGYGAGEIKAALQSWSNMEIATPSDLPPLPPRIASYDREGKQTKAGYTAAHMREYGRDCAAIEQTKEST